MMKLSTPTAEDWRRASLAMAQCAYANGDEQTALLQVEGAYVARERMKEARLELARNVMTRVIEPAPKAVVADPKEAEHAAWVKALRTACRAANVNPQVITPKERTTLKAAWRATGQIGLTLIGR